MKRTIGEKLALIPPHKIQRSSCCSSINLPNTQKSFTCLGEKIIQWLATGAENWPAPVCASWQNAGLWKTYHWSHPADCRGALVVSMLSCQVHGGHVPDIWNYFWEHFHQPAPVGNSTCASWIFWWNQSDQDIPHSPTFFCDSRQVTSPLSNRKKYRDDHAGVYAGRILTIETGAGLALPSIKMPKTKSRIHWSDLSENLFLTS